MRREVVSLQPYVVLYHSFISDHEAKTIKEFSAPGVRLYIIHHCRSNFCFVTYPLGMCFTRFNMEECSTRLWDVLMADYRGKRSTVAQAYEF